MNIPIDFHYIPTKAPTNGILVTVTLYTYMYILMHIIYYVAYNTHISCLTLYIYIYIPYIHLT